MLRNPDARFSMINITSHSGMQYGCSLVAGTVLNGEPAITFVCSGFPETILVKNIKSISISVDSWCPRCE